MRIPTMRLVFITFIVGTVLCSPIHVVAQAALRYTDVKAAGSLSAKIVDPNGNPIAGATIEEMDENWRDSLRATQTDTSGKFTLATVRGRKIYNIRVRIKNFQQTEFPMKVIFLHWKTLKVVIEVAT